MNEIIAIIPARSGSKGVPDKNIKMVGNHPLIAYSIAAALNAPSVDRVIVSTDSEAYAAIARQYGAEAPFLRPPEYSGDTVGDYPVIKHVLDWLKANESVQPRLVVHLRPTSPLRDPEYIEAAIGLLDKHTEATALRSVHEMSESAYKTFEIEENRLKCLCSGSFDVEAANNSRQGYPKTFQANGYVDVLRCAHVMAKGQIHGNRVYGFITPPIVEVDTLDDLDYLRYQAAHQAALIKKLFGEEAR